ncbi:MAG: hypothetical protein QW259_03865 [Pyrobaculum sp.]
MLWVFLLLAAASVLGLDVLDWNGRPLSFGTAVVFDSGGRIAAASYIVDGKLLYNLPWGPGYVLRVAWGAATVRDVAAGQVIWIYDGAVERDLIELGSPINKAIRTWVYPVAIVVRGAEAGCYARVVDTQSGGKWVYLFQPIYSDGALSLIQTPATDLRVDIFCGGYLMATGRFSIQRGAPATVWNFEMSIVAIENVRVYNAP